MLDIFVEVSVMEFVKLYLVFVVTAVEASDARMKRVLNNEAWVRLPNYQLKCRMVNRKKE